MKKYLLLCVEIEETAAKIYRQLAKSELPAELKLILESLAGDEDDHAMQLKFAMRFPPGAAIVDKQVDRSPAKRLLARAIQIYEKTCQQDVDSRKAIGIGIELEQDFCKIHLGNCVEIIDDKLKEMFAALAHDDKIHEQKLIDAKEKFL